MASAVRDDFTNQLREFDDIIAASDVICPPGAGRLAQQRDAAVIHAGVVMLSASFGAYVENLYELAVDQYLSSYSNVYRKSPRNQTRKSLNNANVFKLTKLFLNLGIPWITEDLRIHWRKFTNAAVRNSMDDIVKVPKSNAHGVPRVVRKRAALKWKDALEKLADTLDEIVADHINQETGTRPW